MFGKEIYLTAWPIRKLVSLSSAGSRNNVGRVNTFSLKWTDKENQFGGRYVYTRIFQ